MKVLQKLILGIGVFCMTFAFFSCNGNGKKIKDTLKMNVSSEPDTLNPFLSEAADTRAITYNIFEGLMSFDSAGDVKPGLASSVTVSENKKTYTFKIRENVLFHNGKTLSANDVLFSYNNFVGLNGESAKTSKYKMIKAVRAVDNSTFEIELFYPSTAFLQVTTSLFIIPENYKDSSENPIGTGPYKFKSYELHQKVVLEKNENYWNKEKNPKIRFIEIYITGDENSAITALQSKQLDIAQMISGSNAKMLEGKFNVIRNPQNMVQIFGMNTNVKPLNDVRVRQAICYAIDREEIMQGVADGCATAVYSNFSPVLKKYYNDELTKTYTVNQDKAQKLLTDAGYKDGFDLTITVPSNYQFHVDTGVLIAEQLKKIGIRAKIESVEWATWLDKVYTKFDYETTIIAFDGKLDPAQILSRYESNFSNNFMNFKSEEFDKTFIKAETETDDAKQVRLFKDCQRILTEEAPAVFICDPNNVVVTQKNVKGYTNYPVLFYDFSSIFFEE